MTKRDSSSSIEGGWNVTKLALLNSTVRTEFGKDPFPIGCRDCMLVGLMA